jgi:hypothetical protein
MKERELRERRKFKFSSLSESCRNLQVSGSMPLSDPGALTFTETYPRILLIKPVNLQIK